MLSTHTCWLALVAVLSLVIGIGQGIFIWNHFYWEGPYFHDAGWYSAIIHRAGLLPDNPAIVTPIRSYYNFHVSPLISLLSVTSYLVPLARIEWYMLTQGLLYAAMAIAPGLFAIRGICRSKGLPSRAMEITLGVVTVLSVALSGQVLMCWGYPHYEIAIPALLNLALVAWLSGRLRCALALCVSASCVREDGGFHAALLFAGVAAWWHLEGRHRSTANRQGSLGRHAVLLCVMGVACGIVLLGIQKSVFGAHSLLSEVYLGQPVYSHLSMEVLRQRLDAFVSNCRFIWFPLALATVLSVAYRSLVPVIGWIAFAPWLLLNLLAVSELKAEFSIYTGFPFATAMFVPFAMVAVTTERAQFTSRPGPFRWLRVMLIGCVVSSIVGFAIDKPAALGLLRHTSSSLRPADVSLTELGCSSFLSSMTPGQYCVDPTIACHILERNPPSGALMWQRESVAKNMLPLLFACRGIESRDVTSGLLDAGRMRIWSVPNTILRAWTPAERKLGYPWIEGNILSSTMETAQPGVTRRGMDTFVVSEDADEGFAVWGPYCHVSPGNHQVTWRLDSVSTDADQPMGFIDVAASGAVLTRQDVRGPPGERKLSFCIEDGQLEQVEFRYWHRGLGGATLTFVGLDQEPDSAGH